MDEIKNILLCGLGAVGCTIADKISKMQDIKLKILADKTRIEKYCKTPRIFNGKPLNLNYILPENNDFKPDLIIITVKFNGLDDTINNLKNFIGRNTLILPLLNGINADKILSSNFGNDKVLSGFYIGHSAIRSEEKITNDGIFKLVFGSENISHEKIEIIKKLFDKCKINYEIPTDIEQAKWCKFALNIVCNQLSAILKFDFAEMKSNKKFLQLAKNSLKEVSRIASAEGIKNPQEIENYAINATLNLMDNGKTSMLQDIEAKRKTEIDIFAGEIIRLGKKHGILTPYNQVFYDLIMSIETSFKK